MHCKRAVLNMKAQLLSRYAPDKRRANKKGKQEGQTRRADTKGSGTLTQ